METSTSDVVSSCHAHTYNTYSQAHLCDDDRGKCWHRSYREIKPICVNISLPFIAIIRKYCLRIEGNSHWKDIAPFWGLPVYNSPPFLVRLTLAMDYAMPLARKCAKTHFCAQLVLKRNTALGRSILYKKIALRQPESLHSRPRLHWSSNAAWRDGHLHHKETRGEVKLSQRSEDAIHRRWGECLTHVTTFNRHCTALNLAM